MKNILFITLILFSIINCNSKNHIDSTLISQHEMKLDSLEIIISNLQTKNTDNKIIEEYRHLFSLFGIGFGVLIGLFGLIFPILLYVVQIKPTNDTIKETKNLLKQIDENFETSFKEHLKKSKIKFVDEAIDNFLKQNIPMLPNSYQTINMYKNEGFTELQIVRIIKLLKGEYDVEHKVFFATMLTHQEDELVEDYFKELITNDAKDEKCIWGAIYFATYNKQEYLDLIAKIVINGYSLTGMISSLCSVSKDFAILLLNNKLLLEELDKKLLQQYKDYGIKYLIEKTNKDIIESTLFWKKYGISK